MGYFRETELFHHGIKGMRWGVRRYQNPDGTLTPAGKAREKRLEEKREAKRSIRDLSDDELRTRIDRLGQEKKYFDALSEAKIRDTGRVKKVVGNILTKLGSKLVDKGVDLVVEKIFDKAKGTISKYENKSLDELDFETIKSLRVAYEQKSTILALRKDMAKGIYKGSESDKKEKDTKNKEATGSYKERLEAEINNGLARAKRGENRKDPPAKSNESTYEYKERTYGPIPNPDEDKWKKK